MAGWQRLLDDGRSRWAETFAESLAVVRGIAAQPPPSAAGSVYELLGPGVSLADADFAAEIADAEAREAAQRAALVPKLERLVEEHERQLQSMYAAVQASRASVRGLGAAVAVDRGPLGLSCSAADQSAAAAATVEAYELEFQLKAAALVRLTKLTGRAGGRAGGSEDAAEANALVTSWEAQPMLQPAESIDMALEEQRELERAASVAAEGSGGAQHSEEATSPVTCTSLKPLSAPAAGPASKLEPAPWLVPVPPTPPLLSAGALALSAFSCMSRKIPFSSCTPYTEVGYVSFIPATNSSIDTRPSPTPSGTSIQSKGRLGACATVAGFFRFASSFSFLTTWTNVSSSHSANSLLQYGTNSYRCIVSIRKRILIGAVVAGALLVALLYSRKQQGGFMECGSSVALCGVLTLSSGLGPGKYGLGPGLHGLWPENGDYGSSACVYTCYEKPGETEAEILDFQEHEFTKHGACAGVDSADDYFTQARLLPRMNLMCSHLLRLTPSHGSLQACGLASGPLGLIRTARVGGMTLIEPVLLAAGYPVWEVDSEHAEVQLSACAKPSGEWVLARQRDFEKTCGAPSLEEQEAELVGEEMDLIHLLESRTCVPGERGPPCSADADCGSKPNC
ncbi:hypothetical protein EMIHUDRAFT_466461, partial [Emiliania huxleyi CCMP1516]|uniref:Uncharacterized protein n=2 Tax=Emiliania huxleyi TaxID=2903 RepID=A0A0D3KY71_EMIH1